MPDDSTNTLPHLSDNPFEQNDEQRILPLQVELLGINEERGKLDIILAEAEQICRAKEPNASTKRRNSKELPLSLPLTYIEMKVPREGHEEITLVTVCDKLDIEKVAECLLKVQQYYKQLHPNAWVDSKLVHNGESTDKNLYDRFIPNNLLLTSVGEAYQRLIDFSDYVRNQAERLEQDKKYPTVDYITQHMDDLQNPDQSSDDALETILGWLAKPEGCFALVLGDAGTGKSFLLHQLARRLASKGMPIPLLVPMGQLEKSPNMNGLIARHLGIHEMEFKPQAFQLMLQKGHIILLFDGFDEITLRVDYSHAADYLSTLVEAVKDKAKIVVTSRRQHFLTDSDAKTMLYKQVDHHPLRHMAVLNKFTPEQRLNYIKLKTGNSADEWERFICQIESLKEISTNPRMLSFILSLPKDKIEKANNDGIIRPSELYQILVDRWLKEEIDRLRQMDAASTITEKDLLTILTNLAHRLWRNNERPYLCQDDLKNEACQIRTVYLDVDQCAHLLGSGTLLVRDAEGHFSFLDQSVLEWLIARRASEELIPGSEKTILEDKAMTSLMADFFITLADGNELRTWLENARPRIAENPALRDNYLLVSGKIGSANNQPLNLVGQNQRGKSLEGLNLIKADLTGADLRDAILPGRDLTKATLNDAKLIKADLSKATLIEAELIKADLSNARLLGTNLIGAKLQKAILRRAKLVGAQFDADALESCDVFGAAPPKPEKILPLTSFGSGVYAIAWHPTEPLLAGAYHDGSIRFWDYEEGIEVTRFLGHKNTAVALAFSLDGKILASANHDNFVRLWEVENGQEMEPLKGHNNLVTGVAFSPTDDKLIATASRDGTVRLWDIETRRIRHIFRVHMDWILCLAFSHDGKFIATGSCDKTVRLCSVEEKKVLDWHGKHEERVTAVVFHPNDSTLLASTSLDKTVRLWSKENDKAPLWKRNHENFVNALAFSPNGEQLVSASSDATIRCCEVAGGLFSPYPLKFHDKSVTGLAFNKNGELLASASLDNTIRVWSIDDHLEKHRLLGNRSWVTSVVFAGKDGTLLVSASADDSPKADNKVRIWDARSGNLKNSFANGYWISAVASSPDGKYLASASWDNKVRLWGGDWTHYTDISAHNAWVDSVAFSPDSETLASASRDGTVRFWSTTKKLECNKPLKHDAWVTDIEFSPTDKNILASASKDNAVRLWRVDIAKQLLDPLQGHTGEVNAVAFHPKGDILASASNDKRVILWSVKTGQELKRLEGYSNGVDDVVFSPDGRLLATASGDKTVKLWIINRQYSENEEVILEVREFDNLSGHQHGIKALAFNWNGTLLASGSWDNSVRIWDVQQRKCLAILAHLPDGWAVYTPDGRYKQGGDLRGGFWHAINLCRFEAGELDDYVKKLGAYKDGLRLKEDEILVDAPPLTLKDREPERKSDNPFNENLVPKSLRIFISYAHAQSDYFNIFKNDFIQYAKFSDYQVEVFGDDGIPIGAEWDEYLQDKVSRCDVLVLLVSQEFMNSTYIRENEFGAGVERLKKDRRLMIAPIYFAPCLFESEEKLARLQFFKPHGRQFAQAIKGNEFSYIDLVKFSENDGQPIPNANRQHYMKALIKKLYSSLQELAILR